MKKLTVQFIFPLKQVAVTPEKIKKMIYISGATTKISTLEKKPKEETSGVDA
jgi:hypothetical protein